MIDFNKYKNILIEMKEEFEKKLGPSSDEDDDTGCGEDCDCEDCEEKKEKNEKKQMESRQKKLVNSRKDRVFSKK